MILFLPGKPLNASLSFMTSTNKERRAFDSTRGTINICAEDIPIIHHQTYSNATS